jgi:hypothetical protein
MQNLDEVFMIAILAISGILFFAFLDLSSKSKKKFLKICGILAAGFCAIILMETVQIITSTHTNFQFVDKISLILIRIMQWLIGIVCILMSLSIAFIKKVRLS